MRVRAARRVGKRAAAADVSLVRGVGLVGVSRRGSVRPARASKPRAAVRAEAACGWSGAQPRGARGPATHTSRASPRAGKLSALFTGNPAGRRKGSEGTKIAGVLRSARPVVCDGLARDGRGHAFAFALNPRLLPSASPAGRRSRNLARLLLPEPSTPEAASNISTDATRGRSPRGLQNLRLAPLSAFSNFARLPESSDFDGTRLAEYSRATRETRGEAARAQTPPQRPA